MPIEKMQLEQSDVITLPRLRLARGAGAAASSSCRPTVGRSICTEYLARGAGSTFDTSLPIARKYNVGMINWGFVLGKTQTSFPWDSWQKPYTQNPPVVWHHDVFRADGRPYRQAEVDQIRALTDAAQKSFDKAHSKK